jgi:uncharacterized membrane protein
MVVAPALLVVLSPTVAQSIWAVTVKSVMMSLTWSRSDSLSVGITALAALVGVALWPQLPAEVAIHFSASGTPDNYVPKAVGATLLPVLMLATLLVTKLSLRADPPSDPRTGPVLTVAITGFLGVLHVLVLAWNAGYAVSMTVVLAGSLGFAALLVGYTVWREGVAI